MDQFQFLWEVHSNLARPLVYQAGLANLVAFLSACPHERQVDVTHFQILPVRFLLSGFWLLRDNKRCADRGTPIRRVSAFPSGLILEQPFVVK